MSTLLSLRQALGKAVDELPPLAGTKDFAAKEREIEDLERTINDHERAEKRAAGLARPVSGGDTVCDIAEINPRSAPCRRSGPWTLAPAS